MNRRRQGGYVPPIDAVERVRGVLESARRPLVRRELTILASVDERTLRAALSALVREGVPVNVTNAGCEITQDPKKLEAGSSRLLAAAISMIYRANRLSRIADFHRVARLTA